MEVDGWVGEVVLEEVFGLLIVGFDVGVEVFGYLGRF